MGENETLSWTKQCSLKWSDFKAEHNPASYEDSHSVIKYGFTWTVDSEKMGSDILFLIKNIQISVEFCPLLSSVRPSEISDQLLKYEQGRFDLAELVKRENLSSLQMKFEGKKFPTRGKNEEQRKQLAKEDSGKMIAQEIEHLQNLLEEKLREYDEITDYGNNLEKVTEFNLKFEQLKS
ncbi:hypothetical protein AAA799B03_01281 [Marine Group I thaumarchaeote SCGC AAA799-B03]|uniref:Uncharacterized protein n=3 Tax=Marine Group I TaxID=905826 RepID=A0A087S631_9ARCH|nr:hypothetical protein AAA799N04_01491 [Marine Group I thaumarchaeote SCGC AAA799-N04]KFM17921.1 hypothetical protein SCCGRSA3_01460 [Marine Group I thaumarchaeote SCGC RSA3]KFM21185.1 hypothetical protein AAA799B03_01281 [Marine Group I thaumarchaeote SCGC AAA799-B03]